jgi:hypothetical protein
LFPRTQQASLLSASLHSLARSKYRSLTHFGTAHTQRFPCFAKNKKRLEEQPVDYNTHPVQAMADLTSDSINKQSDNIYINKYEPRQEDISDLRPWGTKKYDRAGGFADVSSADGPRDFFLEISRMAMA